MEQQCTGRWEGEDVGEWLPEMSKLSENFEFIRANGVEFPPSRQFMAY